MTQSARTEGSTFRSRGATRCLHFPTHNFSQGAADAVSSWRGKEVDAELLHLLLDDLRSRIVPGSPVLEELAPSVGVRGHERDHALELRARLLLTTRAFVDEPEIEVRLRVVRIQRELRGELFLGFAEL